MTEGLLLRLLSSSSAEVMSNHKVIILDEIHERHISCDFLLGLIKCLVVQNSELRVILMSATANLELFSGYFDNCPVIEVSSRNSSLGIVCICYLDSGFCENLHNKPGVNASLPWQFELSDFFARQRYEIVALSA